MTSELPTADLIEFYKESVHTPDSWARSVVSAALEVARDKVDESVESVESVEITIPAQLKLKICKPGDTKCNGGNGGVELCFTLLDTGQTLCLEPVSWIRQSMVLR